MAFHLFPLLPPEIRLQIWYHALTPRKLTIHRPPDYRPVDSNGVKGRPVGSDSYSMTQSVPAILHVDSEARELALKYYEVQRASDGRRFYYSKKIDGFEIVQRMFNRWEKDRLRELQAKGFDMVLMGSDYYSFNIDGTGEVRQQLLW